MSDAIAPPALPSSLILPAQAPIPEGQESPETKRVKKELLAAHASIKAERWSDAERRLRYLIKAHPKLAAAMAMLATVVAEREDFEESIRLTLQAIEIVPNVPEWYGNLCVYYRVTNQFELATNAGARATQLSPNNPSYFGNLAIAMLDWGKRDASNAFLIRAQRANAAAGGEDFMDGHRALAENLLTDGDWVAGWHENSLGVSGWPAGLPKMQALPWNGMTIPAARILIHADAGYGDVILFSRFYPQIVPKCAEVIVACSPEMEPLLRSIPNVKYVTDWTHVPPHAVYCKGMNLPELLGAHPGNSLRPPYLHAPVERKAHWKQVLDETLPKDAVRVGLSWHGKPLYPHDPYRRRSIPIELMAAALADIPGCAFVNLQTKAPTMSNDDFSKFPNLYGLDWKLKDWGETAAVIENLDVVVAIDSAVANLAGALDCRTFAVVPRTAAWRWWGCGQDPSNLATPWYPSVRICRQPAAGDWEGALAMAADGLRKIAEDRQDDYEHTQEIE